MTDENETKSVEQASSSRTSRRALAATAAVAGAGAMAATGVAQDDETIVMFAEDYRPGADYDVLEVLNTETKDSAIENAELGDAFDDPSDWEGYVIGYDVGGTSGSITVVFSEEVDFEEGDSETMSEEASVRNANLGLVETT